MDHRATVLEISLNVFRDNIKYYRSFMKPEVKICHCVKANAYGLGLEEMAKASSDLVDTYSVATVNEGIRLRNAGITHPIILLSPHLPEESMDIALYNLSPIISDTSLLESYAQTKKPIKLHLKIDTGMGRIGCTPKEAPFIACAIKAYPNLSLYGVCSHFPDAEDDPQGSLEQIKLFEHACSLLKEQNLLPPLRHMCNSAGTLHHPEAHYDMVRVGSGFVGFIFSKYPHPQFPQIHFCITLKSKIALVKNVPAGTKVSYGGTWETPKTTTIGILPIGYADGLPLTLSKHKGKVLIEGKFYPIVGKICMDQTIIDITGLENPLYKEAVIFTDHPIQNISAIVEGTGTSVAYFLTSIPTRVPKIYK